MISTLVVAHAIAFLPSATVSQDVNAQKRFVDMIERYQNKLCASGTIVWTVKSPKDSLKVKTDLQYLNPNKVYINQTMTGGREGAKNRFIVSDGKAFAYFPVNESVVQSNSKVFAEPVKEPRTGKLQTTKEIYIIGAKGLLDKSTPLDIVMGRPDNLAHLDRLIATVEDGGRADVNGQTCRVLKGKMRTMYDAPPSIDFTVSISAKNDLVQMQTVERFKADNGQTITMLMIWDVDVTVNDEKAIKSSLFKLPKTN